MQYIIIFLSKILLDIKFLLENNICILFSILCFLNIFIIKYIYYIFNKLVFGIDVAISIVLLIIYL